MGRNHRLFGHTPVTQIIDARYLFNGSGCYPSPFVCLHLACTHANTLDLVLGASSSRPSTPTSFPLPAAHVECRNGRVLCWPSRKASGKRGQDRPHRSTASPLCFFRMQAICRAYRPCSCNARTMLSRTHAYKTASSIAVSPCLCASQGSRSDTAFLEKSM